MTCLSTRTLRPSSRWLIATANAMSFTKEDHKATFERSLATGGCFRSRVSTGEKWPKDIYARRYTLVVIAVTDGDDDSEDTATFRVSSADIEPRYRRGYNPLDHGEVEVVITDDIDAVIRTAIRGADHKFFETYTPISNREARDRMLFRGIEFSEGYKPDEDDTGEM